MDLSINGKRYNIDVEPQMPLLWVLRDVLNLTGTKFSCGIAFCGACTVQIDGAPIRSCVYPVSAAVGREIKTIEGLSQNKILHKVQQAWVDNQVPQCGYCQSGMIMAIDSLLKNTPSPSAFELENSLTNICRCGTYQRIKEAVVNIVDSDENKVQTDG